MAQYSMPAAQTVAAGQNVILDDTISCNKGYVLHNAGSGVFTLRGATQQCRARYKVTFNANVTSDPAAQIMLALTLNGEPLLNAVGMAYPAAAGQFANVAFSDVINIPCGCCFSIAVRNTGTDPVTVQNANLIIERVA